MTWTWGELALLFCAGTLTGMLVCPSKDRKSRPIARLLALFFEPIFFWFDLYSPAEDTKHRQPSHSKVAAFMALVAALVFTNHAVDVDLKPDGELSWPTVFLACAVLAFALGRSAYNALVMRLLGAQQLKDVVLARTSGMVARPTPPGMSEEEVGGHETRGGTDTPGT